MQIPGLGEVVEDADLDQHRSEPIPVPVLGGELCQFTVEEYNSDAAPEDFHAAIRTFLSLDQSALTAAAPAIFAYYRDITAAVLDAVGFDDWYVEIESTHDVFDHIQLGTEPTVARDPYGDRHVYVSVECGCDWEPEHGLQIVFRDGATITKVGPYDGHLTNSAAYDDDTLDDVIYVSSG